MVAQLVSQVGSVAATVVLARLLTPGDFGLVALAQSMIAAASLLSLSGINAALVTRRGDIEPAASSYFWLAGAVGVAGVGVMALLANPLASALGQPDAGAYIIVLAVSFPLNILCLIPNALLLRSFRIAAVNYSIVISSLVYFAIEVSLAFLGLGAWAVIIGQVAGSATGLLVSMVAARWLPRPRLAWRAVQSDLRLTWGLGVGQAVGYLHKNADYWATSAFVGQSALGVYYVAYVIPNIIRLRLSAAIRQVMLPAYAAAGSPARVAELWRRTGPVMIGIGLPALAGIALLAEPLVLVFFGGQWAGAVAPLQILTAAAACDLFFASVGTVAMAQRQVRRLVRATIIRAVLTAVLSFVAAAVFGTIVAIASAVAVAALLGLIVQDMVIGRPLGVGVWTVRRPLAGCFVATATMCATVLALARAMPESVPQVLLLVVYPAAGVAVYCSVCWFTARTVLQGALRDLHRVVAGR